MLVMKNNGKKKNISINIAEFLIQRFEDSFLFFNSTFNKDPVFMYWESRKEKKLRYHT